MTLPEGPAYGINRRCPAPPWPVKPLIHHHNTLPQDEVDEVWRSVSVKPFCR